MNRITLAIAGMAVLASFHLDAQQGPTSGSGQTDRAAACTAMVDFMRQHPDAMRQMLQIGTAPAKADSVPVATRQAIAGAILRRDFDSATTLTRGALADGNDPRTAEAIGKVFQSIATIADSAHLSRLADGIGLSTGTDFNSSSFKAFAILPDTLRNMLFSAVLASANPSSSLECEMNGPPPLAPTPPSAPAP